MAETAHDLERQLEKTPEDEQEFVDASENVTDTDNEKGETTAVDEKESASGSLEEKLNREDQTDANEKPVTTSNGDKEECLPEDDVDPQEAVKEDGDEEDNEALDGEEDDDEFEDGLDTPARGCATENEDQLSDTLDSGQEENEREIMMNSKGMEEDDDEEEDKRDYSDTKERILLAAENGEEDVIQELLSNDPLLVNVRDGDSYTPLHRACYNNNVEVIKVLISHGADISAKTEELWEPLHCACKWDNVEAASLLIHNGANVNAVSKGGLTPLHLAAANKNGRRTIELLMWHPYVDATLKNTAGDTAFDIAYRSGPVAGLFEMLEESVNVC